MDLPFTSSRNFKPKRPDCNKIADNLTPDGVLLAETELSSNFSDLKPSRPVNHKAEFKKTRETLATDGEVGEDIFDQF